MNASIEKRQKILEEFLKSWPVSRLESMTLSDYIGIGDKNTLAYWLEFGDGRYLGSIKGGDASKFGIYERKNEPKGERNFIGTDGRYSWKNKYGDSSRKAFNKIKNKILETVRLAAKGDSDSIEKLDFETALKWKLAYLYQDHKNPCVMPMYNLERFKSKFPELEKFSHPLVYRELIKRKGDENLIEYAIKLWKQAGQLDDEEPIVEDVSTVIKDINSERLAAPLNQILYGPPGTGKTYETIFSAVKILDPEAAKKYKGIKESEDSTIQEKLQAREQLKTCFDNFSKSKRIRFVTFHQSFSYEDFVEGLGAEIIGEGKINYSVKAGVFKQICRSAKEDPENPYVLIIDEINRGNISKIFGELITLIEESKRNGNGNVEALNVTLPYSKELFSVPSNVYIVGTMNTSDRSLAGFDIALRRRFWFQEMPPQYSELNKIIVEGINIGELLIKMNERIEVLIGRDYCLGHAYFMSLTNQSDIADLALIFKKQIFPLLQEYFFEDWQRIRWVLNDHRKHKEYQFITEHELAADALFGANEIDNSKKLYRVHDSAFALALSYIGILDASKLKITSASSDQVAQ